MEKYLNATREQFKALVAMPVDSPLQMLNLLKFKEKVEETGLTGAEQYKQYMKAAHPYLQKANAKVLYTGNAKAMLIGPESLEWDKVLIVEYAKKEDFLNMVTDKDYPAYLREMALADSRLIFCTSTK